MLDRIQQFLRATAAKGREVVEVGPFTAYFDRADALKFLNYAVPNGDVAPAPGDIELLREAFRARERLSRLEWVEECAPRLAAALETAGMTEELHTPLMGCSPSELLSPAVDVPVLSVAAVGDDELREASNVQRVAFGQPPLGREEQPRDQRRLGGGSVIARSGSAPAAAGTWTAVIDGVSEVVGIATAEEWRRRGLAGVVTSAAARDAFAAGASLCVISPGGEEAQRVYERAGFRRIATMLHWSDDD